MTKPCAWCDRDFQPPQRHHQQQCCSRACGQRYRQEKQRRTVGYQPPQTSGWRNYPTKRGYDPTALRLKAALLPRAIGTLCPFYHADPQCPGLILQEQRLALDHRIAVAVGGQSTLDNVRITHHDCNLRAGARLGAQQAQHKRKQHNQYG